MSKKRLFTANDTVDGVLSRLIAEGGNASAFINKAVMDSYMPSYGIFRWQACSLLVLAGLGEEGSTPLAQEAVSSEELSQSINESLLVCLSWMCNNGHFIRDCDVLRRLFEFYYSAHTGGYSVPYGLVLYDANRQYEQSVRRRLLDVTSGREDGDVCEGSLTGGSEDDSDNSVGGLVWSMLDYWDYFWDDKGAYHVLIHAIRHRVCHGPVVMHDDVLTALSFMKDLEKALFVTWFVHKEN